MVFSSLIFICVFLPIVLLVYNLSKNITYKNIVLSAASLVFYAWGEPVWVILLVLSSITDYCHGLIIEKYRGKAGAKAALISSLTINLGILCLFKYSGFFAESINGVLGTSFAAPQFTLPVGISFYTFQTLSYVVDVYKGKVNAQMSYLRYLTYLTMFPQLVAGPIVRYRDISAEIRKRTVTSQEFADGARRFVCGLTKKVLLANNAGAGADAMLSAIHPTMLSSWLGIVLYTFQIYFDFSGYSDMAIGLGRMLGFKFKENFEHPYVSRSVTEFWRRWHISLSSFFRDYVYIPLGGNRRRHILNILIVWSLTGLWHGASMNFVFWGLFFGIILIIEKKLFGGVLQKLPFPICHMYTMLVVMAGWTLFYFTDMTQMLRTVRAMAGIGVRAYDLTAVSGLCKYAWVAAVCFFASMPWPKILYRHFINTKHIAASFVEPIVLIVGFGLCMMMLAGQSYNPFLYFRF